MKNLFLKIILVFLVLSSVFGCFNKIPKNKTTEPQKLLLVATLDDSVALHRNDTAWIKDVSCLELRIDTINTSEIIKDKKSDNLFLYREQEYERSQLFSLSEYENIKNYNKIISFRPVSVMKNYMVSPLNEGECFQEDSKKKLYIYYNEFFSTNFFVKTHIYLTNITVLSDEGNEIIVNDIVINMAK
ncbi:MAG: hypothetical protein COA31_002395 [Flavobacteriales bacterium]|nr:hypothetical protein [Flavobacteriales bacterium]